MADSNDIAGLQIALDATSVDDASKSLDSYAASADRAGTATEKLNATQSRVAAQTAAMARGYSGLSATTASVASNLSPLTQKLKEQVELFGKSPTEIAAYKAAQAGLSSTEQQLVVTYAKKLSALQDAEGAAKAMARTEEAALAGVVTHAGGATAAMQKFGLSNRIAQQELLVLGREVTRGNWTRVPGSFSRLAQNADLSKLAVQTLINPFVLLTAATVATIATIADLTVKSEHLNAAINQTETALTASGRSALLSRQQIADYIKTVSDLPHTSVKQAEGSITALASVPNVDARQIDAAVKALDKYAAITGSTIPQAAKKMEEALRDPSRAAEELHKQFGFLTDNELANIEALGKVHKDYEALDVLLGALNRSTQSTRDNLTQIGKASDDLGNAWHRLGNSFSADDQGHGFIAVARDATAGLLNTLTKLVNFVNSTHIDVKGTLLGELAGALAEPDAEPTHPSVRGPIDRGGGAGQANTAAHAASTAAKQASATATDTTTAAEKRYNEALIAQTEGLQSNAAHIRELTAERTALQNAIKGGGLSDATTADYKDRIAALNERINTSDKAGTVYAQKMTELQEKIATEKREISDIAMGQVKSENASVAAIEAWLETAKKAHLVTAQMVADMRAAARAADDLAETKPKVQEIATAKKDNPDQHIELDAELARLSGDQADSQLDLLKKKFEKTIKEMTLIADQGGLDIVHKIFNLAAIGDAASKTLKAADAAKAENSTNQNTVNVEANAGLITHSQAQDAIVAGNLKLADADQRYVTELQADLAQMDQATPAAAALREQINKLGLNMIELRSRTNELADSLRNTFQSSVADSLKGLIEHKMTPKQALGNINTKLQDASVDYITKQISNSLTTGLFQNLGGGKGGGIGGLFSSLFGGGGAAGGAAASAAPITSAFATGGGTAATAITSAFSTGGAAAAAQISMAMSANKLGGGLGGLLGGGGDGGMSGLSDDDIAGSVAGPDLGAVDASLPTDFGGLAGGGFTGPGGKYEPAGIVHRGEFVNRQEVVSQPGAVDFLHDFNRHGMQALQAWSGRGFGKGGYVDGTEPDTLTLMHEAVPLLRTADYSPDAGYARGFAGGGYVRGGFSLQGAPVGDLPPDLGHPARIVNTFDPRRPSTEIPGFADGGYAAGLEMRPPHPATMLMPRGAPPKPGVQMVNHFHITSPNGKIDRPTQKQIGAEAFRSALRAHGSNN